MDAAPVANPAPEVAPHDVLNARYRSPGRRGMRSLLLGSFDPVMPESSRWERQRAKVARRKPGRKWHRDALAKAAQERKAAS